MPPQSEGGRGIDADPSLFISTFGSGRPILCLYGIEAHGLRFLGLSERMPGVKVVAPDLRGHGRSPIEGPWTIEQHLADILPILDGLGPKRCCSVTRTAGSSPGRWRGLLPNDWPA